MDHTQAPVLAAPARYHERGALPFTPPGHKQGRGADPEVVKVLGEEVFRANPSSPSAAWTTGWGRAACWSVPRS
ncbi:hypothetical protein SANTM175S_02402 [Streptomyces antimycoticus]